MEGIQLQEYRVQLWVLNKRLNLHVQLKVGNSLSAEEL